MTENRQQNFDQISPVELKRNGQNGKKAIKVQNVIVNNIKLDRKLINKDYQIEYIQIDLYAIHTYRIYYNVVSL